MDRLGVYLEMCLLDLFILPTTVYILELPVDNNCGSSIRTLIQFFSIYFNVLFDSVLFISIFGISAIPLIHFYIRRCTTYNIKMAFGRNRFNPFFEYLVEFSSSCFK